MSFNLERFRFMREKSPSGTADSLQARSGSTSPDSEKENKPVRESSLATFTKKQEQDTTGLDSEDPLSAEIVVKRHQKIPKRLFDAHSEENKEREEKVAQLTEMFPQRSRGELLEAFSSTSTLDGAVAFCLMAFKDEGTTQKRKNDASDSDSQDSADVQPHKKRKKDPETEEPMQDPSSGQQKAMVKKLQKAFPNLDKEELREVLHEHEWQVEEAIEVLRMFSDPEESSSSPEVVKEPKSKPSKLRVESSSKKPVVLSDWLTGPKGRAPSPAVKPSRNRMMKAFSKKGRNQRAHSESGSEGEDSVNSDFEGSSDDDDDDSDQEDGMSQTLKESILEFLQEASLDELSLISSCSLKKAQKIVELRPFHTWEDLKEVFHKVNGLSEELLWGCKVVLKERAVVLGLMGKCETISRKMLRHVNSVIQSGTGSMKQPAILNSKLQLKPYQLIGLNWLALLHRNNLSGILADEMGLGKTIQAVSFLASLYEDGIEGPHLITVPSSTLDNWVRELKLWCPSLKVLVYYGSVDDRKYLRYDILNKQVDFNVIISTYNLAIGNESDRSLFRKLKLQCAVFDEGHMLKNMNSLRYRHLMAIKAQYRLLLTGTPLQNNLLELISLLNFIMPSMFSSSTSQIAKMFSMKSSEEQSSFEKDRITQAKQIMKPFILRRVKSEVLKQLPAKEETVEFCRMSEKQQQLYLSLMEKLKRSATDEKKVLNNVMMQLRKMANHPLLHRQYYTSQKLTAMSKLMLKEPTHHDANPILIKEDMEVMSDFELHNLCQQYSSLNGFELERPLLLDSGKFALLTELLASLKEQGDRVVLFSQFTMMLDILEVLLQCLGHRYVRLDGSTPMADRIVLIDQYNTEPEIFVFLLSTRAGGLGINLTSANVVILHDIDCNPYNDKQAEDRCHRVGQTRIVRVIKLISQDSIEDCMLRAGQKKLKLEQDMTAGTEGAEGDISDDMASLLKASLGL